MALAIPGVIAAIAAGLGMRYLKEQAAAERKAEESIQKINQSSVLEAVKSGNAADWTPETWQAIVKQGWGVSGKKAESVTNPLMLVAQTVRAGQQRAQASQAQLVAQFLGNQPQGGAPTQAAEMEPPRNPQTGQPIRPLPTLGPGVGVAIPPTVAPVAGQAPAFGAAPAPAPTAPMPVPSFTPAPPGAPQVAPGPQPEGAVSPAGSLIQELGGRRGQPNVSGTLSVKDPVTWSNLSFTRTSESPVDLGRRLTTIFTNPRGQYRLAPMGDLVDAASAVGADLQNDDLQRLAESRLLSDFQEKVKQAGGTVQAQSDVAREMARAQRFRPDFLKPFLPITQDEEDRTVATAATNWLAANPERTAIEAIDHAQKLGYRASPAMANAIRDDHARVVYKANLDRLTRDAKSPLEQLVLPKVAAALTFQQTGGHLTADQFKLLPETPPLAQDVESELRGAPFGTTGAMATPEQITAAKTSIEAKRQAALLADEVIKRYGAQGVAAGANVLAPGGAAAGQAARISEEAATTGATRRAGLLQERSTGGIATEPTAGEREAAAARASASELATDITTILEKNPHFVGGPFGVVGRGMALGSRAGVVSEEFSNFQNKVATLRSDLIRAMAGAQIGPAERETYLQRFPDVTSNSRQEFKANLRGTAETVRRLDRQAAEVARKSGVIPLEGTKGTAPKAPPPDDTEIHEIGGKLYRIPKKKAK